ncbi:hypothetical protein OEZ85_003643 [Tetradesmus obliquus]|uniref:Uncharacterized protein n=1 Tax=Tetradesmus obliquus TaxID=3088 RepID=A0ABY8UFT4_TETOB|nr:hypothetical protein OEZ85_003643 [Tetradesmus obliquus]
MASRIVAQLLVAGATTVLRAASQAWHQALQNAHKSGVAQEAVNKAVKSASGMSVQEARMILSVDPSASWVDVTKRYKHMFEVNQKYGSFYLQSKTAKTRHGSQHLPLHVTRHHYCTHGTPLLHVHQVPELSRKYGKMVEVW